MTVTPDDWRLVGNEWLVHLELTRKSYARWSEEWDHDHCIFCWAKFMDPNASPEVRKWMADHPKVLSEGYATTESAGSPADYNWVCQTCFDDLNDHLGFSLVDDAGNLTSAPRPIRVLREDELGEMPVELRRAACVHLCHAAWPLEQAFDAVEWFAAAGRPIQALDAYRALDDGRLRAIDYFDCAPLPGAKKTVSVEQTELAAIDALTRVELPDAWIAVVPRVPQPSAR